MSKIYWQQFAVFFAVLFILSASVTAAAPQPYVMCRQSDRVRTIRVTTDEQGQCQTYYTKAGVDELVGHGRNMDSCMGFLTNIKGNLESANWSCRDVSSASITIQGE